ncbi:acetyl-CoA acyltransferase [Halobacteriovorax marinus]|uniref:Thiolase n=1 Tax=Halobacteriovorax marinus (strain ATCC BAA-682 / DSM 15412 / SJ) TaxID=862908 RepID=E1X1Y4_HALMS|nr:acetyl-CoA C-acyltransferase [Halobacteriovorax marinus]ATH07995.1 acetyl-CoA acyltransferase [Halobacteriovorax marinus]CBW26644.1 putative thiolase [Halobacteriovorax marinus SJ]
MAMKPVYIIDGKRSPHAKAGTDLKDVDAPFLGAYLVRNMIDKTSIPYDEVDEVIFGNTGTPAKYPNISRVIALEAGLDKKTSAYSVHRNCASGMEAVSQAFMKIASGRSDIIIAGGVESMSQMPLIYSKEMTDLFVNVMKARTVSDKLKAVSSFRPPFLSPIIAIEQGLTDPFCGLNMGQTAEVLAREFGITRDEQDAYANESHLKATKASEEGKFDDEILPILYGEKLAKLLFKDVGPRANSTVEGLGKMKPYFEKRSGTVTVGNSCPITDGGSALIFASEEAVEKYDLKPIAKLVDFHFHGLEPERMGMGPLLAMDGVFKRTGLGVKDMDLFEINEAFAAQLLAVTQASKEGELAKRFGLDEALGEIPSDKLNVNGGAIALGHPVGSTGSRLIVTLMHELKRRKAKYGVASLCIGGGQGGACIIENLIK